MTEEHKCKVKKTVTRWNGDALVYQKIVEVEGDDLDFTNQVFNEHWVRD